MKVQDIRSHFLALAPWVDAEKTVDQVIVGDPAAQVRRAAVTWISSFQAVRTAVASNCQLLITHEPTFWEHRQELAGPAFTNDATIRELALRKRSYIETHGLVILRIHDVWDRMPELGIPYAWAKFLGFTGVPQAIGADGYQHRYDIAPVTVDELACRIAQKTAALGESCLQVAGNGEQIISRIGIGTGCVTDPVIFQQMGCDVSVVSDDGTLYWRQLQRAMDDNHPFIRVNHGTSEEPGIVTLAQYMAEAFPEIETEHIPHGSCFHLVGTS